MDAQPTIVPLDEKGELYALRDQTGAFIGTGTREVCEMLQFVLRRCQDQRMELDLPLKTKRPNVRAAIEI